MDKWADKVAIVTGSTLGIGAAIAKQLVCAGLKVVGLDVLKNHETFNNRKGEFFPLIVDVSQEDEVLSAFSWIEEHLGPVHILINNAAINRSTTLVDGDINMWKDTVDTNVHGLCIMTRETIKNMRANNVTGHIVHINSLGGHVVLPLAQLNIYPATKYAVTALTETLRLELNAIGSKTKITSISPGYVKTAMLDNVGRSNQEKVNNKPALDPDDVASAVLYALSTPPHVQVHDIILAPI